MNTIQNKGWCFTISYLKQSDCVKHKHNESGLSAQLSSGEGLSEPTKAKTAIHADLWITSTTTYDTYRVFSTYCKPKSLKKPTTPLPHSTPPSSSKPKKFQTILLQNCSMPGVL